MDPIGENDFPCLKPHRVNSSRVGMNAYSHSQRKSHTENFLHLRARNFYKFATDFTAYLGVGIAALQRLMDGLKLKYSAVFGVDRGREIG